ncbi:carbohydrate-binding module family 13 protein [Sphaerobolus stellatus SS14]|uniref:Carbohydrate-binding module family 13 protein n=1 Tax=Sphaerobolus stellatus (strain SS14) TaxID=990650 RepID=A0A0C9V1B0_SPHS4|nr:carbohydrate-binding module family 13 protein [Sphaerobolus stellatus SS14]
MTSLFFALVATAVLVGVQAQIVVPSPGNVIQIQPTFRGAFPRTPCLTVFGATNGSALFIQDCSASTEERGFQLTAPVPSIGQIQGQIHIFNTFCLEAPQATNGAKVFINSCVDDLINQEWTWNPNGQIRWAGSQTAIGMCLDLTDGNLSNGNQMQIWDCDPNNANENQIWTSATLLQPLSEIINTAAVTGANLCMAANSSANGSPVFVVPCFDTTARRVWIAPQPGHGNAGSYQLSFGVDGGAPVKCLDVTDGVDAPGTKLQLWDCTEGPNQQFLPAPGPPGNIRWNGISQVFPMCVDLTNGVSTPGNQLQIWNCSTNINQAWFPIPPRQLDI